MNDLDLIERLRAAGTQGPAAFRHTPDAVLAAGRRAQARRNVLRISGATLGLAALVVAGMQLTPGSGTQAVIAAGDGAPGDAPAPAAKPAPQSVGELDPHADQVNAAILQSAMGDDFDVADDNPNGTLRTGTDSAAKLPAMYSGTVDLMAGVSNAAGLKAQCTPMTEKGAIFDGCVTRTLPDGREVQAQFSRWAPTAQYPQMTAGEAVRVLFLQPNGVLVWVDLVTSTDADNSTTSSGDDAKAWLDSMMDRLGAAAADPSVEPDSFDQDALGSAPAEKAPAPEDSAKAKKVAAAKEAAAKEAAGPAAAPADEKAIAAKKAAAAEADQMDAKKAAAAKECAAAGTC